MTTGFAYSLWQTINTTETRDFIVSPDYTVSYKNARQGIKSWLTAFDEAGLSPGDRIVVRTGRDDVACLILLAALVDGIVPVLLEANCPDHRFSSLLKTVEPHLVLVDATPSELTASQAVQIVLPNPKGLRLFGAKKGAQFGTSAPPATRPPRFSEMDDLAYLLFTSGTTAEPSGVMIATKNLSANLDTLSRVFQYDAQSRIFNDMALAHTDGMTQGPLLAAWNGATLIRAGGFDLTRIEDWLGAIPRFGATHVLTVPTVWAMIENYAAHDDYFDAPACKMMITGAAKMPLPLWDKLEARFKRPLVNHYGLSETVACALYSGDLAELGARGTLGKAIDCDARVAGHGHEGELLLRGDNIFQGYWRNPTRTADSFTDDGWFRTGDLVRARDDGSYDMLGRLKAIINSGGVNIHPDEIDEALLEHPSVLESVTIAMPDDVFDEIGVSCVTLQTPVSTSDLAAHLLQFVEPRKASRHIIALPEILRGPSGKPRLDALRVQIEALLKTPTNQKSATDILTVAAEVFRVEKTTLSLKTSPDTLGEWDSFTHLNLVMAVETHFDIRIPAAKISTFRSLADIARAVDDHG